MKTSLRWSFPLIAAALLWAAASFRDPGTDGLDVVDRPPSSDRTPESANPARSPAQAAPTAPVLTVPSASTERPVNLPAEIIEMTRLRQCLASQECEFPKTDPASYDFALSSKWEDQMRSLAEKLRLDPSLAQVAAEAAREGLRQPDGHVQEAALEILKQLPPSEENLKALVEGLHLNPVDPLILDQASSEMSRYVPGPHENAVYDFFASTMSGGALSTAAKASVAVRRVLTPQSANQYRQVLQRLPADSTTARNLRSTLDEYDRQRTGG